MTKSSISAILRSPVSAGAKRTMAIILAVFVVFYVCLLIDGPDARQARNMKKAAVHRDRIAPGLSEDARFRYIGMSPCTGDDGSLEFTGYINSTNDLLALKQVVAETEPPVVTRWAVRVVPLEWLDE